jgi:hypothetical protein
MTFCFESPDDKWEYERDAADETVEDIQKKLASARPGPYTLIYRSSVLDPLDRLDKLRLNSRYKVYAYRDRRGGGCNG